MSFRKSADAIYSVRKVKTRTFSFLVIFENDSKVDKNIMSSSSYSSRNIPKKKRWIRPQALDV